MLLDNSSSFTHLNKNLRLKFHGKILDQLGFQTYQSPVASLAELVANSWDADAKRVNITIPDSADQSAEIVVEDDGLGMTLDDCQDRYLNVGYDTRAGDPKAKTPGGRHVMGRKGIGKFAGFGIARKLMVQTTSDQTGEKTIFEMDINELRSNEYLLEGGDIPAKIESADMMKEKPGTKVILKGLSIGRAISLSSFPRSLARRFLVQQISSEFEICVNGKPIPKDEDLAKVEFTFPKDYEDGTAPVGMRIVDGWGIEELPHGKIRWKFFFNEDTIRDEDLRGIAIFANKKLVQKPFFFNLSGGLGGQAGQSYMFGRVIADYVDQISIDPVSLERQRLTWELDETEHLLEWGQKRVKELLVMWHDGRGKKKREILEEKVLGFKERLDKLSSSERNSITRVLMKIGGIPTINDDQFKDMAGSILTSWEGGRLKDLWLKIANTEEFSEADLLHVLMETEIVSALNVAEAVKAKLLTIAELKLRVEKQDLENAIRNYIAENPWLISPEWDTFKVERSVKGLIGDAAKKAGLTRTTYQGRVDLVLASGKQLLVLEFMRPGLPLNWDHLSRVKRYFNFIKAAIRPQTGSNFTTVSGYVVADNLGRTSDVREEIENMKGQGVVANDWNTLLGKAKASWDEYLHILVKRGNGDPRLESLLD